MSDINYSPILAELELLSADIQRLQERNQELSRQNFELLQRVQLLENTVHIAPVYRND